MPGEPQLGDDAVRLLAGLARRVGGGVVRIREIPFAPRAHQRLGQESGAAALVGAARAAHETDGSPFWEALLVRAGAAPGGLGPEVARAATLHQDLARYPLTSLPADDEVERRLRRLLARIQAGRLLVASSLCSADGDARRHIPMLDFSHKAAAPGSLATVRACVERLEVPGAILTTGRSFHFYGVGGCGDDELRGFLGRALLLAPIVDGRWVAHQLIEGSCGLRLGRSRHTEDPPRVVAIVP